MAQTQLLLLEDVDNLGRSGDIVKVRPGYARNFLLPRKKALIANKGAIRRQAKLREEREKKTIADRKEAEKAAKELVDLIITATVKVDPEGHPYGSVSALDLIRLLGDQQKIVLEKRNVLLKHPIKSLGTHRVALRLKEGVEASVQVTLVPEGGEPTPEQKKEQTEQE